MLECTHLTVGYEETPILRDIDLKIDTGEIVGIVGKNGAGKTTLLKTLIGLLEPMNGDIEYDEADIVKVGPDKRARRGIGYVPQGRDIFPDLTVEQNLLIGERIGADKTRELLYDEAYNYFPILDERRDQKAGTMSGGQQQMLAIARALIGNPDLLLLDEPSEGIQPSIVNQIAADMKTINKDLDVTILFVEQNLSVIHDLAERCYVMARGEIVDELSSSELKNEANIAEYLAV